MTTSTAVRAELVEALRLDLIGPDNHHAFAQELLPESPISWYLSSFLVPRTAPLEQRTDATAEDDLDAGNDHPAAAAGCAPPSCPPLRSNGWRRRPCRGWSWA